VSINDETLRLARQMRVAIDRHVDQAVRDLVKAWARAWDEIHDAWAAAAAEIAAASADESWLTPTQIARGERAQAALAAATEQIAALGQLTGVKVTDATGRIVEVTPEWQARLIGSQMPAQAGTTAELVARFNRADPLSLSAIVQRTTQQITASAWTLSYTAAEQMRRALVLGVALGDNPRKTAREIVRRAEGTFNGGLTRALTIARTETLDAHRDASAVAQLANADVLTGWTWLAQLDTRTCPSCWAMHGTEHDLTEAGPNDHQQGRCARMPTVKPWSQLGFTGLAEPKSALPDAEAVFADLTKAQQLTVMGPARMQALDAGVPWSALSQQRINPGWRTSQVPTPARDLLARVA